MATTQEDLLDIIVGKKNDSEIKSTLQLALNQARLLVGYDNSQAPAISRVNFETRDAQFISECIEKEICADNLRRADEPALIMNSLSLYLICLDQIGHIFFPSTSKSVLAGAVVIKMEYTEKFGTKDAPNIIDALRNSLCHNFGLSNKNNKYHYKFSLNYNEGESTSPIVEAKTKWDGIFRDISDHENDTVINIFPFMQETENLIAEIVRKYETKEIACSLSANELKTRFTIIYN